MEALPHHYTTTAKSTTDTSIVVVYAHGVPELTTDAPAAFGGPGDQWSPEGLLMAAVADCFILTFRAISAASKINWQAIECQATGTLDRIERQTLFTAIELNVSVTTAADVNQSSEPLGRTVILDKIVPKASDLVSTGKKIRKCVDLRYYYKTVCACSSGDRAPVS